MVTVFLSYPRIGHFDFKRCMTGMPPLLSFVSWVMEFGDRFFLCFHIIEILLD